MVKQKLSGGFYGVFVCGHGLCPLGEIIDSPYDVFMISRWCGVASNDLIPHLQKGSMMMTGWRGAGWTLSLSVKRWHRSHLLTVVMKSWNKDGKNILPVGFFGWWPFQIGGHCKYLRGSHWGLFPLVREWGINVKLCRCPSVQDISHEEISGGLLAYAPTIVLSEMRSRLLSF